MSPDAREEWQEDEVNLLDYWRVLKKHGWVILGLTLVATFSTGYYSHFVMPKIYESTARIMATRDSSWEAERISDARMAGRSTGQVLEKLVPSTEGNRSIFMAMLKSRSMTQDLSERFTLKEYYKEAFAEDAVSALQRATEIKVSREGVISVTVQDKDPRLAADIANAYITLLDRRFAKVLVTSDVGRQRAFIADELEKSEKALQQAEEALRQFQENNKGIVVHEQAKATTLEAAKLKGQIVAAEVQQESLRTRGTKNNPHLPALEQRIEKMKRQLAQIQGTRGTGFPPETAKPGGPGGESAVAYAKTTELGKQSEYLRLVGEIEAQETAYHLLTQQFEQTKIREARDLQAFLVLDKAVPAERKSKPRTVLNIIIAGTLSLIIGVILAFFLEYLERIRKQQAAKAQ